MRIRKVSRDDLNKALSKINEKYDDNVIFNRFDQVAATSFQVTLRVQDSKKPGHRIGHSGRRMVSACWHVHGDFFDALLEVNCDAIIKAGDKTITKDGGNWQDWNIGSMMEPLYYSQACDYE